MSKPKSIDVTRSMLVETDLAKALREWRDAGGPVMDVVDTISQMIEERITLRLAQDERLKNLGASLKQGMKCTS